MSQYLLFNNKLNKTLVFYPVPKNANSSAKLFFAKHLNIEKHFLFISDKIPKHKQKIEHFKGKRNLVNFLPTKQPFKKINADFTCCIVRNPIERFISSYQNRVLYHKDIKFRDHTIDEILDKLLNNNFENLHFLPQSFFLGNDMNYFSFYCFINEVNLFESFVNSFFDKKIKFPMIQVRGKEDNIKLNLDQIKKIRKIYSDDFNLLKITT